MSPTWYGNTELAVLVVLVVGMALALWGGRDV